MALLYTLAVVLSLAVTASTFFASVMISRLDFLVNDLYNYGLVFSQEWATPYAEFFWSLKTLVTVAATLSCVSTFLILIPFVRQVSEKEAPLVGVMKFLNMLFISVASVLIAISMYFSLSRLDFLVHNDLYNYGLFFSQDWAIPYWENLAMIERLMMTAAGLGFGIILLIFRSRLPDEGIQISLKRTWLFPMFVGFAAIGFAFYIESSILAMIGLGSAFCGLILRFLTDESYTRKSLLDAAVAAQILSVEKMIEESMLQDRIAVYLPLKYLTNSRENKVHLAPQTGELIITNESKTISPPGDEIVKILENKLQKSFVEVDLPFLEKKLPNLLSEFEIAEKVEIRVLGNQIIVEMMDCIYVEGSREIMKSSKATRSLGSPVTSAIACALAKAIAKPIIINKETINLNILKAEYTFLGENTL